METKEFKIEIPEGFVIDSDNSDLTKGIVKFKKIDVKPRSWEEFCATHPITNNDWFIGLGSSIENEDLCDEGDIRDIEESRNYCTSKEEAKAFLALMQLRQLRKAWVGDWEPSYSEHSCIYYDLENYTIRALNCLWKQSMLSFPTFEMAQDFINCPKIYKLLEQAKILL